MKKSLLEEFRANVLFIDALLRPINQGFLSPVRPSSLRGWFWQVWPIWYGTAWICIYTYLILTQGRQAGQALVSQQIWGVMCVVQFVVKSVNGLLQVEKLQRLFNWCEGCYTMDYRKEYEAIVNSVFQRTNIYIRSVIRWMTGLVIAAGSFYVLKPIILRVRETPTRISINGNDYWADHVFVLIYLSQTLHAFCIGLGVSAYDDVFIQFTMSMRYRFRTMTELLSLLNYLGDRDDQRDRRILVDICEMHHSVLDAIALFRSYFFFYGVVQLGTNVMGNCAVLLNLQTTGYDSSSVGILLVSTLQVFVVSLFGQLLQSEASRFSDALYETNWCVMCAANKKSLLMLMTGSKRVVNIRAGGTIELNLALFGRVMKAGVSLCAVMQAM